VVVVVVKNGNKRRRRAAVLTRVHNSFFFPSFLSLSFFSFFFPPWWDRVAKIAMREDRHDHCGWWRVVAKLHRAIHKEKKRSPAVRNDVTPQGRVLRWRTRVLILSSTAMTCSAIKFTSFYFFPTPTFLSLGINLVARASKVYGNKISAINIKRSYMQMEQRNELTY